jgi:hypothetical protein
MPDRNPTICFYSRIIWNAIGSAITHTFAVPTEQFIFYIYCIFLCYRMQIQTIRCAHIPEYNSDLCCGVAKLIG